MIVMIPLVWGAAGCTQTPGIPTPTSVINAHATPPPFVKETPVPGVGTAKPGTASDNTLRALAAARGITIGNMASMGGEFEDERCQEVLGREFNLVVPGAFESSMLDRWGFGPPDTLVNYALNHNMKLRGHYMFWPEDQPEQWKSATVTKEQMKGFMQDRVRLLTSHYGDLISEWIVVNEAVWDDNGREVYHNVPIYQKLGAEYVDLAFKYAREAAPKATLIYNDFGIETPGPKTDFIYNMLRDMKARGVPVDGIGMQYHIQVANPPSKSDMVATMKRFAELGLSVYITELDVNLINVKGTQTEKYQAQAKVYRDVVEAALESKVCKSITIWGISDQYSWLIQPEYKAQGGGDALLLYDNAYQPKPAYEAVREALKNGGR
jgi:endo-1,4-beta-xylanase